jgi:hypothetical protein
MAGIVAYITGMPIGSEKVNALMRDKKRISEEKVN